MTSQAQSIDPLAGVRGLVFFGFPLHPGGRPSIKRADHLADVHLPMLFLQGTRDTLAAIDLISAVVSATDSSMFVVNDADHAFHVRKSSGGTDEQALNEMASAVVGWMDDVRARES